MNWWNRLLTWLGVSKPGRRKEQVETWIENNAALLSGLHDEQETTKGRRGEYRQVLRQDRHLKALPAFAEMRVDVYEAPVSGRRKEKETTFGYTTTFEVTEADGSVWTLTLVPGTEEAPEWKEVKLIDVPGIAR